MRAIAFHKDILARIDARDTDGAAQAMRAHLTDEIAGLAAWQKAHPELFAPAKFAQGVGQLRYCGKAGMSDSQPVVVAKTRS